MVNAREAIESHLELLAESGEAIPLASDIEIHRANPDYADGFWALVDVDITPFLGKSEKINITLPRLLIHQIDQLVKRDPRYKSRSGFLAKGAQILIQQQGDVASR